MLHRNGWRTLCQAAMDALALLLPCAGEADDDLKRLDCVRLDAGLEGAGAPASGLDDQAL